jgi:hypothetical protein
MNTRWAKRIRQAYLAGVKAADAYGNVYGGAEAVKQEFFFKKMSDKTRNLLEEAFSRGELHGKQERFARLALEEISRLVLQEQINRGKFAGKAKVSIKQTIRANNLENV